MTLTEYANNVRIRHACSLISYTNIPTEKILQQCGFNNIRNFNRVFMHIIGTTPARYRTTHRAEHHLQYPGNPADLITCRPKENCFTYTVNAGKRVDWPSVYDYMTQIPPQDR
jgi:AraC-like DNA-binding protein